MPVAAGTTRPAKPGRFQVRPQEVGGRPITGVYALVWVEDAGPVHTITTMGEERLPLLAEAAAPWQVSDGSPARLVITWAEHEELTTALNAAHEALSGDDREDEQMQPALFGLAEVVSRVLHGHVPQVEPDEEERPHRRPRPLPPTSPLMPDGAA